MLIDIEEVWKKISEKENKTFKTFSGLEFSYTVKGHEIFISRKNKSITYSSVKKAMEEVEKLNGVVSGPKKLGVFGASYIYPILMETGVIQSAIIS